MFLIPDFDSVDQDTCRLGIPVIFPNSVCIYSKCFVYFPFLKVVFSHLKTIAAKMKAKKFLTLKLDSAHIYIHT